MMATQQDGDRPTRFTTRTLQCNRFPIRTCEQSILQQASNSHPVRDIISHWRSHHLRPRRILTDVLQGLDLGQPLPDGMKLAVSYLRVSTRAQADTDYDEDGLSIAAQREANQRKAGQLGAVIVAEFMDKAESAKAADRPELQAMLKFIRELGSISYVIVDKVDRLARNREDDVLINISVRQAGAQLVSSKENIDETPSGKLLHGIMATIAEFYSANLAMEAMKGMRQKAKVGGTPGLAPLGYRNVREHIDGREIRTVAVDLERAPLIQWMFSAYATGDWTMSQLCDELERRGLRIPATRKRPARPVSIQHIDKMLMNRYYLGFVKFEGIWHQGRHTAHHRARDLRARAGHPQVTLGVPREAAASPALPQGLDLLRPLPGTARRHQREEPLGHRLSVLLLHRPREDSNLPATRGAHRGRGGVSRGLLEPRPALHSAHRGYPGAGHDRAEATPGRRPLRTRPTGGTQEELARPTAQVDGGPVRRRHPARRAEVRAGTHHPRAGRSTTGHRPLLNADRSRRGGSRRSAVAVRQRAPAVPQRPARRPPPTQPSSLHPLLDH